MSPRAPCACSPGSRTDGVSDVVPVVHPPCGLENRCTVPESLPPVFLPDSPIAILLPSAFADTDDPKALFGSPSDAVSLAAVDVADDVVTHPMAGFVNTYAAPLRSALACSAPTTTVLPSPLAATA